MSEGKSRYPFYLNSFDRIYIDNEGDLIFDVGETMYIIWSENIKEFVEWLNDQIEENKDNE